MINQNGDAVIIDFGGGFRPEYIPKHLMETIDGDLMGLERLKEELLDGILS